MEIKIPGTKFNVLSKPSKMRVKVKDKLQQVYSFGLKAGTTCPGATYNPNHKCTICYAQKGHYLYPTSEESRSVRTTWTQESMKTEAGRKAWIDVLKKAVHWATKNVQYFRNHHSGDYFSAAYVDAWHAVVREFPEVKFWNPTSTYVEGAHPNAVNRIKEMMPNLLDLASEPNVILRPSAREVGLHKIIEVEGFAAGTGVISRKELKEIENLFGIEICPAKEQGNVCGECTTCWDRPLIGKYYPDH